MRRTGERDVQSSSAMTRAERVIRRRTRGRDVHPLAVRIRVQSILKEIERKASEELFGFESAYSSLKILTVMNVKSSTLLPSTVIIIHQLRSDTGSDSPTVSLCDSIAAGFRALGIILLPR